MLGNRSHRVCLTAGVCQVQTQPKTGGRQNHTVLHSRPEGTNRPYAEDLLRLGKESVWELLGLRRGTLVASGQLARGQQHAYGRREWLNVDVAPPKTRCCSTHVMGAVKEFRNKLMKDATNLVSLIERGEFRRM